MPEDQSQTLRIWYEQVRPLYEGLCSNVQNTLENLIRKEKIDYLSVTSRPKTLESLLKKAKTKAYKKPQQEITDLSGIRVITYIESDVTKISELIRTSFHVHPSMSLDKTDELGIDRFGYRSVHFVCDLGEDRIRLPEFSPYSGLFFEVQIRTVLQHAWAEIEHDRNYKFSGVLPTPIQRRLHLLAGVLEIVDREFTALASEVDGYTKDVLKKTRSGDLDIEINTTSLLQYLPAKLNRLEKHLQVEDMGLEENVIDELRDFGLKTLADLERILTVDLVRFIAKHYEGQTLRGILRDAMMYEDIDRYFEDAWKQHWTSTDDDSVRLLSEKYDRHKVLETLRKNHVDID
jgi:putative GTP pyrophosphokinase